VTDYIVTLGPISDCPRAKRFIYPRPGRMMLNLPIKDHAKLCCAMEKQIIKPKPGTLLMFNSYLPHEFRVDDGIDSFRFIHFNLKAVANVQKKAE